MGNFGYGGMSWIGMIVGLVITIAVIVGLIILVVWIVQRMSGNAHPGSQNMTGQAAKDVAQVRYAKGEITRDEYQQIIADMGR